MRFENVQGSTINILDTEHHLCKDLAKQVFLQFNDNSKTLD